MENASDALLIAGSILIALTILGMGVYLVTVYSNVGEAYGQKQITAEIENYNKHFTVFENRKDITIQEIVTLKKFAHEYAIKNGITKTEIKINLTPQNVNPDESKIAKTEVGIIKEKDPDIQPTGNSAKFYYYECTAIGYDDEGRVNLITLKTNDTIKP